MKRSSATLEAVALLLCAIVIDVFCSTDLAAQQSEVWSCRSGDYEFTLALDGPYLFETIGQHWLRHSVARDDQHLIVAYDVWGSPENEEGRNVGSIVLLSKTGGNFMRYRLDMTSVFLAVRAICTAK